MDHLDGVVLDDLGLEIDEDFDNASQEEQKEVINWYLENLELQRQKLADEIDNNELLHSVDNAFKFVEAAARGDIEITTVEELQKGE